MWVSWTKEKGKIYPFVITKGERLSRDTFGVWDSQLQTAVYEIEKQLVSTVECIKLYLVAYN